MNRTVPALVGAALVAGGLVWLAARSEGDRDGARDRAPAAEGPIGPAAPMGSQPSAAGPSDHVLDDTEHGTGGDDHPAAVTWYRQLSTLPLDEVTGLVDAGVGSDLPDDRRRAAREVAGRFVVADLSGLGRDEFPTWWGSGRSTAAPALACCTDVEVIAAGAAGYPAEEPLVLALVVWSATPVDGVSQFDSWEASFVFLQPAPGGSFTPVDPSTVDSWHAPAGLGLPSG